MSLIGRSISCVHWLIVLFAVVWSAVAWTRTPAVEILQVAIGEEERPLAPCAGIRLLEKSVLVKNVEALNFVGKEWYKGAEERALMERLEEAVSVVLVRSERTCVPLVSVDKQGRFPAFELREWNFPFQFWKSQGDVICLVGGKEVCLNPGEYRVWPVSYGNVHSIRLYHHGRKEISVGEFSPPSRKVGPDAVVQVHLEGPGDEKVFIFSARQPGWLLLERTPGHFPDVWMLIDDGSGGLQPAGLARVLGTEPVPVVFRSNADRPIDLDVAFLFTPEPLFTCMAEVSPVGGGKLLHLRLVVKNEGERAVVIQRPSIGTVEWYMEGSLVAAARPGRLPEWVTLNGGEVLEHHSTLSPERGGVPDSARIELGAPFGVIHCNVKRDSAKGS